jgi:Zn-dependent M28 family amino/carboxypeptidase
MLRFALRAVISLALLLGVSAGAEAGYVDIANQVSVSSYQNYLDNYLYTHNGDNRAYGAQHDLARTNIANLFTSFGLSVTLSPFLYSGSTYYNVVATKLGTVRPNDIYIVGAHYDSYWNPGADDDASGVAGVLEAARVLADETLEATVTFIAFDREEQGLIGSTAYANAHASDNILGMISLDMIAYHPAASPNSANVLWTYTNTAITQDLSNALLTYSGINSVIGNIGPYSDHAPFAAKGKDACLLIEYGSNPYYHTALDSVDTSNYINYAYGASMTRGVVGYLAENAEAVPEPSTVLLLLVGVAGLACRRRRRCRMPDAGCRMPDAGCQMPDARCQMPDARCQMPDARCR